MNIYSRSKYLCVALMLACLPTMAAEYESRKDHKEYDFHYDIRYPGRLRSDTSYDKVTEKKGDIKEYKRRVVEWWPKRGVDFTPLEDIPGAPKRTWTPVIPDDTWSHTLLDNFPTKPFEAHLVCFRGVGDDALADVNDPNSFRCPTPVLLLPDGTFSTAAEAVELVHAEAERWREEKHYFGRQVTVRAPSDADAVEALKKTLEDFYKDALPDETETYKTLSALGEAIDNAAHYGNSDSSEVHVTVTIMLNDERIAIDVKDEGTGFDFDQVAETSAADAGASIGMKMMRECTDEIRFSEEGTRVTLVKRRAAEPGVAG